MYTSTVTYENKPDTINFGVNTDHLGNVRAVVSDIRQPVDNDGDGETDEYQADVKFYADYYPYGMLQPGRSFNAGDYRFGFNGMEADDEIAGVKNSYTTHFRQYDPSVGRWWSVDPEIKNYPWQSPYVAFDNNPINIIDPRGNAGSKPEKLKKAAKKGIKEAKKYTTAACNIATQKAVDEYTKGKVKMTGKANQMAKDLKKGKYKDFESLVIDITKEEDREKLQNMANKGELIVGAYENTKGTGHTIILVPGELEQGDNWKRSGKMPQVMEGGAYGKYEKKPLTFAAGQTTAKGMKFYVYKPSIEKTNDQDIQQKLFIKAFQIKSQEDVREFFQYKKNLIKE